MNTLGNRIKKYRKDLKKDFQEADKRGLILATLAILATFPWVWRLNDIPTYLYCQKAEDFIAQVEIVENFVGLRAGIFPEHVVRFTYEGETYTVINDKDLCQSKVGEVVDVILRKFFVKVVKYSDDPMTEPVVRWKLNSSYWWLGHRYMFVKKA